MGNISLPPAGQPRHLNAYLQHFGLIAKHKYSLVIILTMILITAIIIAVMIQNSAATTHKTTLAPASVSVSNKKVDQPVAAQAPSTAGQATIANSDQTTTQVKVNNQTIPVPENGSVEKTITSNGGTTNLNISVNSTTNASSHSSSSTSLHVNTNSSQTQSVVEDSD